VGVTLSTIRMIDKQSQTAFSTRASFNKARPFTRHRGRSLQIETACIHQPKISQCCQRTDTRKSMITRIHLDTIRMVRWAAQKSGRIRLRPLTSHLNLIITCLVGRLELEKVSDSVSCLRVREGAQIFKAPKVTTKDILSLQGLLLIEELLNFQNETGILSLYRQGRSI